VSAATVRPAGAAGRDLVDDIPTGLLIGGVWAPSGSGRTFEVQDPATGAVLARIADADPADGLRALDAADAAASSWAETPPRRRSDILRRAFDLLMERKEEFAALISSEMGKPLAEARGEIVYGGEFLRWFSEEAVRISGRVGETPEGTGRMLVSKRAVGPCLLITPWNFPLAMATRKIAPALAAGCTVIVKPADLTPLTTLAFVRLLEEAGLPAGVVNVVTTTRSPEVCAPILADPRLRKLSFTGSTAVGRALLRQAADGVLRTSMELGGNAPFLVFEDADLDRAVDGAMLAKFRNMGEACTAANRFLVHEDVADEFTRRIADRVAALTVGHGLDDGTDIGPLIDHRAVENTAALVAEAVEAGARTVLGGDPIAGEGSFFQPTVVTGVPPTARIAVEEIFGPVLAVTTFSTEDEAVRLANDTEYGLVSYVFTSDLSRGDRMIEALHTGMMGLNTGLVSNAAAPFGGVKSSGLGREGGSEGIEEYLETKYTLVVR
jgi:succinate-semialdehyde dehydrogenase/glutarate-semialdehyde dehydrogenase